MNYTIEISDALDEAVRQCVLSPLVEYNVQRTGVNDHRPLAAVLKDNNGSVIGGLIGRTGFGWLHVELLFVPESIRGQGVGTELMRRAEAEAVERGCHSAWLDTFEFQAKDFYERLGYKCFGKLGEYPAGFSRHFMKKVLSSVVPSG